MEQIHNYVIADGKAVASTGYNNPKGGLILYEVMRVIDGAFLFLDDHLERLNCSAQLAGVQLPFSLQVIRKQVHELVDVNQVTTGNVKLVLQYSNELQDQLKYISSGIYFIAHRYPSLDDYRHGVSAILFRAERENPNAKIIQQALRDRINKTIAEKHAYEAILVHPDGYITEGSRSNFFMVANGQVFTAPQADILPGITRKYVLQICHEQAIPLVEQRIPLSQLSSMEAVFISGTSPKILPIAVIDHLQFAPDHPIVTRLMQEYDQLIHFQIQRH